MNNSVCPYNITVKNIPEDIYIAVGKVIELAQDWEERFKELASLYGVGKKEKSIEKYSLNKLNEALKKIGKIEERIFEDFKVIIDRRNYINHRFFLDYHNGKRDDLTEGFTDTATLICEATDYINEMIEDMRGNKIGKRPTIFDSGAVF